MTLARVIALVLALLPSAAHAVFYRVDFVVEGLELIPSTGNGSSLFSMPQDGVVRGAYFYDETPFSGGWMDPDDWHLSWGDGETGMILRVGEDTYKIITSPGYPPPDSLAITWLNDDEYIDEEYPPASEFRDYYQVYAAGTEADISSVVTMQSLVSVPRDAVLQGAPLPALLTGASYTDLPDLTIPVLPDLEFELSRADTHGNSAILTGEVTAISIHVVPVPEPDPALALGAGAALLAALSRRRSAASIARSISS
jgi:hypothetical protein